MEKLLIGTVIGSLLLAGLVPAAKAAAPVATAQVAARNHEKHSEIPTQMSQEAAPTGWDLVSFDEPDNKGEKQLPERVMERGAGKFGAAAGSALASVAGYALFGLPGAVVAGSLGAVVGEVFFETIISNLLRSAMRGPLLPRMNPRWIPVK